MKTTYILITFAFFPFLGVLSQQSLQTAKGITDKQGLVESAKKPYPVYLPIDWPDYVFEEGYPLMPIHELRMYVQKNKHLPNVPDTGKVQEEGINLAEMDKILLEKIEELTLYILQQEKRIEELEKDLKNGK